jgi:hypothetical protein
MLNVLFVRLRFSAQSRAARYGFERSLIVEGISFPTFWKYTMAAITINDLHANRTLDRKAMASIKGGGAPWVYGWIRPHVDASPSVGSSINFYQINNSYHADQMINQVQVVEVNNSAPNSNVNVVVEEHSSNQRFA